LIFTSVILFLNQVQFMRKNVVLKLFSGVLFLCLLSVSCTRPIAPSGSVANSKPEAIGVSSPACIIYRTRSDYSLFVPVTMSADKSKIVSYPDIKDIFYNGKLSLPSLLVDGFLLDNRGIGLQVAFLKYTYEEYSRLPSTPLSTDLMNMLLDKDPLVEMYQCGQRSQYSNIEQEMDLMITSGKLKNCKKLK
jgi:hypothetical protein